MSLSKLPTLVKQNNNRKVDKRPKGKLPIVKTVEQDLQGLRIEDCRITWLGPSAIYLEMNGLKILIDPQLGKAASPLPFTVKRFTK